MSNRIEIIRGTSFAKVVDLLDVNDQPLLVQVLAGASAEFVVQVSPDASTNVIRLTTAANPTNLAFRSERAALNLALTPIDTLVLALQTYFYRLRVTLADGTTSDAIPWSPLDVSLGGSAVAPPPPFENTVKIDHDYQLPGELTYVTAGGSPVDNAQVRVYLKSDYVAGKLASPVGVTITDLSGKWRNAILVNPGFSYIIRFEKPGEYGPDTHETFA